LPADAIRRPKGDEIKADPLSNSNQPARSLPATAAPNAAEGSCTSQHATDNNPSPCPLEPGARSETCPLHFRAGSTAQRHGMADSGLHQCVLSPASAVYAAAGPADTPKAARLRGRNHLRRLDMDDTIASSCAAERLRQTRPVLICATSPPQPRPRPAAGCRGGGGGGGGG